MIVQAAPEAKTVRTFKVIAPDLVIESAEYGAFVTSDNKTKFVQTTTVSRPGLGEYGWRLKVKTTRKVIHWSETGDTGPAITHVFESAPENGYIQHHLDWAGDIKGTFHITVNIEGQPVKTFTIKVQ